MATELTEYAKEGLAAATEAKNPYIWSSSAWAAWQIGRWLRCDDMYSWHGRVFASRGTTYRVGKLKVRVSDAGTVITI